MIHLKITDSYKTRAMTAYFIVAHHFPLLREVKFFHDITIQKVQLVHIMI